MSPPAQPKKLITTNHVFVYQALKTPQFWLIWWVLCLNVTAGIGVLGQASAMSQEMFPGRITAAAAAGFVGLMSLFNMGGRFFWASVSDYIGRKNTYFVFFALGFVLYATVPLCRRARQHRLFVLCFVVIISMYGGGFATVPAYLKDMFGTRYVGAIHGMVADRLVGRRHLRAGAGELHPAIQRRSRHAEGAGLQRHDVPDGGAAGRRFPLQPAHHARCMNGITW